MSRAQPSAEKLSPPPSRRTLGTAKILRELGDSVSKRTSCGDHDAALGKFSASIWHFLGAGMTRSAKSRNEFRACFWGSAPKVNSPNVVEQAEFHGEASCFCLDFPLNPVKEFFTAGLDGGDPSHLFSFVRSASRIGRGQGELPCPQAVGFGYGWRLRSQALCLRLPAPRKFAPRCRG